MSFTPGPSSLGDMRELMQRRVKLYLGFLLVQFGAFYVLDATDQLVNGAYADMLAAGNLAHLGLVIAMAGMWQLMRSGDRSTAVSTTVEAVTTIGIAVVAVVVLNGIRTGQVPAGPMLAMALVLVGRAAIVPSTGKRTLTIGIAVTLVIVIGYYQRFGATGFATFTPPWMVAFSLASAFVSRVIYGLQAQVREARELGQYVLEQRLGEGGMGVVYRARHRLLRRPTAVKLMSSGRNGERDLARFEDEVRQTARLSHPNTVTIYDYGRSSDGVFYYAMELLDGFTLETIVAATGALHPARVARVLAAAAGAVAEAHGIQLIHRDLKPANIMLCQQGGEIDVVKVLDFGLVKDLATETELTQEGSLTGTPAFMSPESIQEPKSVGPQSDIYALGAVGYYLLTGQHVFGGKTVVEICSHHLMTPPEPPSRRFGRSFPAKLEALILECLDKRAALRPASTLDLRARLMALDDVGTWSEHNARQWWDEHRETLRRHQALPASSLSATLAVDVSQRS